jgi:hypothetical protein
LSRSFVFSAGSMFILTYTQSQVSFANWNRPERDVDNVNSAYSEVENERSLPPSS